MSGSLQNVFQDFRRTVRTVVRHPIAAAVPILTLALGIGSTAAIVSAVEALLLRPLPYAAPDRLVTVWEDATAAGFPKNTPAPANYFDWLERNQVFSDMAATLAANANLLDGEGPEQVLGRRVTSNFFAVLGVQPQLGRTFTIDEDRTAAPVVVISDGLWRRRYNSDPGVIGRAITMSGARTTVIGVMPRGFIFRNRDIDFWSPASFPAALRANRNIHFLNVVARLRDGVDIAAARDNMNAVARQLAQEYVVNAQVGAALVPIREDVLGDTRLQLLAMAAAVACMLLITCANLGGALLARAAARGREAAVRTAVGAPRRQLIVQMMMEGLVWSIAGGLLGLAVAYVGLEVLHDIVPLSLGEDVAPRLDLRLAGFTVGLALLTGVIFSALPAISLSRVSLAGALKQGGRSGSSAPTQRGRQLLVTSQVALTFVLLAGAGLMLQSMARLSAFDVGFDSEGLLTMRVPLPGQRYADPARRNAFHEAVLAEIQRLPGVTGAGFASTLPFASRGNTAGYRIEGRTLEPDGGALFRIGTPGYLAALGVRLRAGRLPTAGDGADAPPVVVINEAFARKYWPSEPAVGHRIALGNPDAPWMTIVGVVSDVYETGYEIAMRPGIYLPSSQVPGSADNLLVRTTAVPTTLVADIRRIVQRVDPEQPTAGVRTMDALIDLEIGDRRRQSILLATFAALAILQAAMGLFSLLAFSVAQQSRDFALRMALGATTGSVHRMVLRQGLTVVGVGLAIGLAVAVGGAEAIRGLLYGVEPNDPRTLVAVATILMAISAAACWVPTRRAARTDPAIVFRQG